MKILIKSIIILLFAFPVTDTFGQTFMEKMQKEKEEKEKVEQVATPRAAPTQSRATMGMGGPTGSVIHKQKLDKGVYTQGNLNIKNRWKGTFIHVETGKVSAGALGTPGWHSAQWEFEPVAGDTKYFKIKNRWKGTYLHVEKGYLAASALGEPGWHSAQWEMEFVQNSNFVKIKNRWKGTYLHVETGRLVAGSLGESGWHSAQWELLQPGVDKVGTTSPVNDHPNAVDMYFRYTDQVSGGRSLNLKVGDRIKVLPGQTISDGFLNKVVERYQGKVYYGKSGLSFDAKNPKICGKIFTVKSVSPLQFTEEFPEKMRNTSNSNFKFKVIKL